jgi:hypothetical protein
MIMEATVQYNGFDGRKSISEQRIAAGLRGRIFMMDCQSTYVLHTPICTSSGDSRAIGALPLFQLQCPFHYWVECDQPLQLLGILIVALRDSTVNSYVKLPMVAQPLKGTLQ